MPLHGEQRVQLLTQQGPAKTIKLIFLDILVFVSIKNVFLFEKLKSHSVGKI